MRNNLHSDFFAEVLLENKSEEEVELRAMSIHCVQVS